MRGNPEAEATTLEQALRLAAGSGAEQASSWLRLGDARVRLGRYAERRCVLRRWRSRPETDGAELHPTRRAADGRGTAGEAGGAVPRRGGGRGGAQRRLRRSVGALPGAGARLLRVGGDPRSRRASIAAREAVRRALDQDPGAAVLPSAIVPEGEAPVIVPASEVFYYVGLAAEADGRASYAESSFREYLTRTPGGRWARAALRHLGEGTPAPPRRPGATGAPAADADRGVRNRLCDGGAPRAPHRRGLARAPGAARRVPRRRARGAAASRVAVELEIDGRGEVTRATVKAPPPLDERFVRCVEGRSRGRSSSRLRERGRATRATRGIRRQSRGRRSSSPPASGRVTT